MSQNKPVADFVEGAAAADAPAATEAATPAAVTPQPLPATEQAIARTAGKSSVAAAAGRRPAASKAAATTSSGTAAARRQPARKASAVDETVARHQKVLAEALEQAEAIDYTKSPGKPAGKPAKRGKVARPASKPAKAAKAEKVVKAEKADKAEKAAKPKKHKLVRDSYAMPEPEYQQIAVLKKRLAGLGNEVKKSEILRCGIAMLAALNDAELLAVMARVERIKTGRPSKK